MENNIKIKTFNNSMKRLSIFILLIITLMTSSYAVTQYEILQYRFEEGAGNIILDTSGFDNHGVRTGGRWRGTSSVFGDDGFNFDGGNDYITSITTSSIPDEMSVSFWARPLSAQSDIIFTMYDTTDEMKIYMDRDNVVNSLYMDYTDDILTPRSVALDSTIFNDNQYYHIVLAFDFLNNTIDYYRDGVKSVITYNDSVNRESLINTLRIGVDNTRNGDFTGDMDEFRIFSFIVDQSQVNSLRIYNTILLEVDKEEEIPSAEDIIIKQTSPAENSTNSGVVNFDIELYHVADCDLFINGNFETKLIGQVMYSYQKTLHPQEDAKYFWYCEYIDGNNTLRYDLGNTIQFDVGLGDPSLITFFISGIDFDVSNENLYITTPCLKHVLNVGEIAKGADEAINKGREIYFEEVIDGEATFNISASNHEFCLVNGLIQYSQKGFTGNFNINEIHGVVELGTFDVPSNITQSYTIQTELLDIYDINDPKAFGETWGSIIGGLILLMLGVVILFAGVSTNNGKIVVAGVLLCLASMGISFTGFLGVLV